MGEEDGRSADAASASERRWLLVSDIDDTLTGDDVSLHVFIRAVRDAPGLAICLNSSRPLGSVQRTLDQWPLHFKPHALITAMGTEIHVDSQNLRDWSRHFDGWDRSAVDQVMQQLGYPPHRDELQTRFKASFAVPRGDDQQRARQAIEVTGLPVRIIISGESNFDVLPTDAGKDHATLFLARHMGFDADRVVVAGDSGNDLAMFRAARRGIVVANARDELRDAVADLPGVYFAQHPHAAGVLEGLRHWGVELSSAYAHTDRTT